MAGLLLCAFMHGCGRQQAEPVEAGLVRDYALAAGTLRGAELRAFEEQERKQRQEAVAQLLGDDSNPLFAEKRAGVQAAFQRQADRTPQRAELVARVERELAAAFSGLGVARQEPLRASYEAALRDLEKARDFVQYGVAAPRGDGTIGVREIGEREFEAWQEAMQGWGVVYGRGDSAWPARLLEAQPASFPESARAIVGGEWKGAWELPDGGIYVPGVAFFREGARAPLE